MAIPGSALVVQAQGFIPSQPHAQSASLHPWSLIAAFTECVPDCQPEEHRETRSVCERRAVSTCLAPGGHCKCRCAPVCPAAVCRLSTRSTSHLSTHPLFARHPSDTQEAIFSVPFHEGFSLSAHLKGLAREFFLMKLQIGRAHV